MKQKTRIILFFLSIIFFINFINADTCTANWTCTDWSPCTNSQQIRSCVDQNLCETTIGRPIETKTCAECIPNWDCTEWLPEECSKDRLQTRTCTDQNSCGINNDRPIETKYCDLKTNLSWLYALLVILLVFMIIIDILLIMSVIRNPKKKTHKTSEKKQTKKTDKKISKY